MKRRAAAILLAGLYLAAGLGLSAGCASPRAPARAPDSRADVSPSDVTRDQRPPEPEAPGRGGAPRSDAGLRNLLIPVDGVEPDRLRDDFDEARSGGRRHQAIDILAPRNTPVRAVTDGTIAKIHQSVVGGRTIYQFDSDGRYCFYYAHLERYARGLRQGDRVRRGQVVGYVGTSGNAPPGTPHLHFAIYRVGPERRWWEGEPLNPYPILRNGQGRGRARGE